MSRRMTPPMFVLKENAQGFSAIELVVTFAVISLLVGFMAYNFKDMSQPALNGASGVVGFVKRTRAKALGTTYAYTITPSSATQLIASYGTTCSSPSQTTDSRLSLTLPEGARFAQTGWSICFSARGIAEDSINLGIVDDDETKTVQIASGGGARFY